jgi:hypothetical protein
MTSVGMTSGGGYRIAPQNLGEVVKFAEVMARAGKMLPEHLQGDVGACMAVAMQALDWQMNPFAVASKSYFVNKRVAYEAQLIAAVVNTRSGIKGRLRYSYSGEGNNLVCTVTGILNDQECEYETPTIGSITTKNSPLWKSDPRQQLGYFAARSWARRHCPEVLLGVYSNDELEYEPKDITPQGSGLASRLAPREAGPGFNAEIVAEALSAPSQDLDNHRQTSSEDQDDVIDPDLLRDAGSAAIAGADREPPSDLLPARREAWLAEFDRVTADAEENA